MIGDRGNILRRILEWADDRPDVAAVVMTGSRARDDGDIDRYSDHDIELYVNEPDRYDNDTWLQAIAPVWVALPLVSDEGYPIRLVFFEGADKVDFQVRPASEFEALVATGNADISAHAQADVWARGFEVLRDRTGLAASLSQRSRPGRPRPRVAEADYLAVNTEFWFEAAHIPRYLAREELWVVKSRDWTMKEMLLQMLEWRAVATSAEATDVWYEGTKMKTWVGDVRWARLRTAFGHFDRADSWKALLATLDLFRETSREVARLYGFDYPVDQDEHVSTYILGFAGTF